MAMAVLIVVKRNPVKNVDNLFPTTKGKNIVCLLKKNVTTSAVRVVGKCLEDHMFS